MRRIRVLFAALIVCFGACTVDLREPQGKSRSDDEEESPDAAAGDPDDDDDEEPVSTANGGRTGSAAAGKGGSAAANSGGRSGSSGSGAPVSADVTSDDSSKVCATAAALAAANPLKADVKQLSGVLKVTGNLRISGEVTIEPGTTFIIGVDSTLEFGGNRTTLTGLGTPDKPIRFCSDKPGIGRWPGLILSNGLTSDSALENVHIYDAGSTNAALAVTAPIRLVDVTIHDSKNDGLIASMFGDGSRGLAVRNVQRAAAVLTHAAAVSQFPKEPTFMNVSDNSVHLRFDRIENLPVKYAKLPGPYVQEKNIIVQGMSVLEFDAGVEYRFATDVGMEVGWNNNPGVIKVNGTAAAPVVFRGVNEGQGSWGALTIQGNVSTDSVLSHVQILDGGYNAPVLAIHKTITVQDVLVKNCKTAPLIAAPLSEDSKNLSVTGCAAHALDTKIGAVSGLPKGGSFKGNGKDVIRLPKQWGTDTGPKGTIPNLGVPYLATEELSLGSGTDISIEPGTEFVFASGVPSKLEIGWNSARAKVLARGTASAPIIFRGERDDRGTWPGIIIGVNVSTDSKLDYVEVRNAGLTTDAQISISNSSFSKSSGFGILKQTENPTDYAATNTFSDNAQGNVGMR